VDRIVILGAGGHGREVHDVIDAINRIERTYVIAGFLDDREPDERRLMAPYLGPLDALGSVDACFVIGIGEGSVRRKVAQVAERAAPGAPPLVHPSALVGSLVSYGVGTIVCGHSSLSTSVTIGRHVSLNPGCTVGHDAVLEDYVTVLPGASISGNVHLGEACTVGTNATVIQGTRVGRGTKVGAGAVVIRDLPDHVTAVGVPARILERHSDDGAS
jgi:sugar O-acyltransferase (sialic acid O-acetyltransferase NeuD family)